MTKNGRKTGPKPWVPGPCGNAEAPYVVQFEREIQADGYEIVAHKLLVRRIDYKIRKDSFTIKYKLFFMQENHSRHGYAFDVEAYVHDIVKDVELLHKTAKFITGGVSKE